MGPDKGEKTGRSRRRAEIIHGGGVVEVFACGSVASSRATVIVGPRVRVQGHVEVGAVGDSAGAGGSDAPAGISNYFI